MSIRRRVPITLDHGVTATFVTFDFPERQDEHIALLFPGWDKQDSPLVRLHSECLTGDVFASRRCDCHAQLHEAIDRMSADGGVLLYLRQEGRGIGLKAKLDAYALQIDDKLDTYAANRALGHGEDQRSYDAASIMLLDLGIKRLRLLTNNPAKISGLTGHGIEVAETISTGLFKTEENADYLNAKHRYGHLFAEKPE